MVTIWKYKTEFFSKHMKFKYRPGESLIRKYGDGEGHLHHTAAITEGYTLIFDLLPKKIGFWPEKVFYRRKRLVVTADVKGELTRKLFKSVTEEIKNELHERRYIDS